MSDRHWFEIPGREITSETKGTTNLDRLAFARTSLFAQTAMAWLGPVVYVGQNVRPVTRGEARRFARAILRLTEKP